MCSITFKVISNKRWLLFLFHPITTENSIRRHQLLKVNQWVSYSFVLAYNVKALPDTLDTISDVNTGWMFWYQEKKLVTCSLQEFICLEGPTLLQLCLWVKASGHILILINPHKGVQRIIQLRNQLLIPGFSYPMRTVWGLSDVDVIKKQLFMTVHTD